MLTRRTLLAGTSGLMLAKGHGRAAARVESLAHLAARSGRFFGSSLTSSDVDGNGAYAALLEAECNVWVPEWQLKWGALASERSGKPDFRAVDAIVAAAQRHGKAVRGHTLLWHEHLPVGVETLSTSRDWSNVIVPHILDVATHYRGRIFQWDVVNEAIEPEDGNADLMRQTPFYRMLGADYVAEAFRLAHEAAPDARLYLNDYAVCYAERYQERRRTGVLRLLERLLGQGVPVHGFGIQGHLDTRRHFDADVFQRFLRELEGLGLELAITELDVREADNADGLDISGRQKRAADEVRKVLSVALDSPALTGVVTWALADHESWLRKKGDIPDNQGLPYDDRLRPTPMRGALAQLFAAARPRA